ncbi:MAG: UDP-N-acetylglucosamine--N-acetylmuramyl-(pentapeptide) pyrophosphoryl-undecaprenol [Actinomycetota bacterium]|jgi:UDP-N-acetylglucosamine--N-acetylmuramyl-(pentapeptide) pyrophosphoryl-undecaprenol N-acetylglucosamine transferase|nr:UDP-N-acetylglucosamine--N-acetylmuramyl-(pentapeptide) pyrophosphoryl-undecaprenol [Actinomycetota bacterium]
MNIVIAAGGTAGHVNPAVAVARSLAEHSVTFIGTATGLEATVVPDSGFALDTLDIAGFDRARPLGLPGVGVKALRAIGAARRVLRSRGADVVLGMGGYVSLPVCVAARSRSIPVVLHEQNIVLGLANKVSKPFARHIGVSFEETLDDVGARGVFTGNPVAPEIVELDRTASRAAGYVRFDLDPARKTVLVFGGSLGARTLNRAAPALAQRWRSRSDIQVLHISGRSPASKAEGEVDLGVGYRAIEYTDAMAEVYAVADVAICRGGATTVAELSVVGLPSVIVPYPHHRDQQQLRHAEILERAGAARVLADADATPEGLGELVESMLAGGQLETMAAAAKRLGKPDAAERLAELVSSAG